MSSTQSNRRGDRRGGVLALLRRLLRFLLVVATLGLAAVAAAPLYGGLLPVARLFQHFDAQLAGIALFCVLADLALGRRRWAVLAAALTLWYGSALVPFLPVFRSPPPVSGGPLTLLSLNLWNHNPDHSTAVDDLLASGADVIGTVEVTAEWRAALKPLEAIYPYHIDCVGIVFRCGVALYSKLPFRASHAGRIDGKLPAVVWFTIDWQGRPLTVAELQLIDPLIGLKVGLQAEQAATANDYFATLPGDLVVMGDFNSAPWSALQQHFRAATGLDNRGRLAFTWPSWAPAMFRLPIDQIFTRGGIALRDFRAGPNAGSDHLPVSGKLYRTAP